MNSFVLKPDLISAKAKNVHDIENASFDHHSPLCTVVTSFC